MGVKLTLLCEGTKGGQGGASTMYIAPTDLLIVFGKVSEGDGTDVSTWGVSHLTASPIYGTVLLDLEV